MAIGDGRLDLLRERADLVSIVIPQRDMQQAEAIGYQARYGDVAVGRVVGLEALARAEERD
jgi:hypothetical protein